MRIIRNLSKWTAVSILVVALLAGCEQPSKDPGPSPKSPAPQTSGTPVGSQADLPGESALRVRTIVVGKSNVTLNQSYTAQVLAAKEVEVRSKISGYLQDFFFREGSTVKAGQVLFSVDSRMLAADVSVADSKVADARAKLKLAQERVNWKKAKADREAAQARLENEQREVERYKPLMEDSIVPRQLYDERTSSRDVAKAQLDAAEAEVENTAVRDNASISSAQAVLDGALANLRAAEVNLDYTTITAPISGVIGELNVYPGTLVGSAGSVLATISSTDPIYVEFAISESDYLTLTKSKKTNQEQKARSFELLLADGSVYDYKGELSMVDRTVDQQTGTLKIRLQYANPSGELKPGQYANVRLNRSDVPDALLVPKRAVLEIQSSKLVWLVAEDDTVSQQEVTLGPSYESSYVVAEGLKAGDRVVVDGMGRLKPGMTVSTESAE